GSDIPQQTLQHVCWILRRRGETARALEELARFLPADGKPADPDPYACSLWLERARVHAAAAEWGPAEKDVEECRRSIKGSEERGDVYVNAHLIKGFVRAQLGDDAAAVECWRRAAAAGIPPGGSLSPLTHYSIAAALAGTLTDAEAKEL